MRIAYLKILAVINNSEQNEIFFSNLLSFANNDEFKIVNSIFETRQILKDYSPDIVISDIDFDDGKINDIIKLSKKLEFPVVVFTDPDNFKDAIDSLQTGAFDYIIKSSISFETLINSLHRIRKNWETNSTLKKDSFQNRQKLYDSIIFLANSALELNKINNSYDVFNYLTTNLQKLTGKNCIIIAFKLDNTDSNLELTSLVGLDSTLLGKIIKLVGFNPNGNFFKIDNSFRTYYKSTRLIRYPDTFVQFCKPAIPILVSRTIQVMLNIKAIYIIGINGTRGNIGNINIFVRDTGIIENIELIETFIYQASTALDRLLAFEKLTDSETRYKFVFQNIQDIYFEVDIEGNILELSPSIEKYINTKREKLIGQSIFSFYKTIDERAKFIEIITNIGYVSDYEITLQYNNIEFVTSLTASVVNDSTGKPLKIVGSARDISSRKKAEEALKNSEEKYRTITENINDVVWTMDLHLKTQYISPSISKLTGFTVDEHLLQNFDEKFTPQSAIYVQQTFANILPLFISNDNIDTNYVHTCELEYLKKDGNTVWTEVKIKPVYDLNMQFTGMHGTSINIDQRKKAETALKQSEERFRSLFDVSPILQIIINYVNGSIISANNTFLKYSGYCLNEIEGQLLDNIIFWESSNQKTLLFEKIAQNKILQNEEIKYKTKTGSERYGLLSAVLQYFNNELCIIFSTTDITEKKITEKQLAYERYLFNAIMATTSDIIYFKDLKSNFIRINNALSKRFGINSPLEAINKNDFNFFTSEHAQQAFTDEQNIINTEKPLLPVEEKETWPDGRITWVSTTKMPLYGENGELIGTFGISRDITEKKMVENELVKAKNKAEESDRLKSAFLANMSHEIRTPMNGIKGFADMLRKPNMTENKRNKYIEIINTSSDQLLSLINDLIDISKIEAGQVSLHYELININSLIDDIEMFFTPNVRDKQLTFIVNKALPNTQSFLRTDIVRLRQVLTNLVSNALKFTPNGTIELGYLYNTNPQKQIIFYVKDTGIGIAPEHHNTIFERFRQLEYSEYRKYGGVGLGLSITRALVNIMHGKIWVESELNTGSNFFVQLPFINEPAITVENSFMTIADFKFNNKTILIAEDENINFDVVQEMLVDTGAHIIRANNGAECVEICNKNNNIDMVLMDWKMPKLDGIEATIAIKKMKKILPIIMLTAYAFAEDRAAALKAGCNAYLEKPVDEFRLKQLIKNFMK